MDHSPSRISRTTLPAVFRQSCVHSHSDPQPPIGLPRMVSPVSAGREKSAVREGALRKFNWVKRAVVMALVAGLALSCFATPARPQQGARTVQLDLARMVDEAENVVLGRVTSVIAEKHPQLENLDTIVVTLQVLDPIKGSPGPQLTFRQYVFDLRDRDTKLGYRIGEEVVLMLRQPSEYGLTSPVGFEQSRFRVERDAANNRVLRNGMDNAGLFTGIEQTAPTLRARLSQPLQQLVTQHRAGPITYDQFKSFVQAEVAARQAAQ